MKRIRERTTVKIEDSDLRQRAKEKFSKNPKGYWDFLESIRADITEHQMLMLIDLEDEMRRGPII